MVIQTYLNAARQTNRLYKIGLLLSMTYNEGQEYGHTEIVQMLLDRGADCYKYDRRRQSPVMKACKHGHTDIFKMLLYRGGDCNKCYKGRQSPVMKSCKNGHTDIFKMLLDRGLDCLRCEQSGLSIAYGKGYNDIIAMINKHSSQQKT